MPGIRHGAAHVLTYEYEVAVLFRDTGLVICLGMFGNWMAKSRTDAGQSLIFICPPFAFLSDWVLSLSTSIH